LLKVTEKQACSLDLPTKTVDELAWVEFVEFADVKCVGGMNERDGQPVTIRA
jgi:hypothetical protein